MSSWSVSGRSAPAAAYWASTRPGARVLGLEQFEFGHANGASGDHSRIIRLSYHRPDYVRLAKRAFDTWAEVEGEAGVRIVTVTGGLDLWPADPAIPMADYTESLAAEAVPFEVLDAAEVMRRWPQWHLADDTTAMWQSRAGLADPYRGNAAHRRLASARGATLLDRTPVTGDPRGGWRLRSRCRRRDPQRGSRDPHGGRLDQRPARRVRSAAAADRHQGTGDLLRRARSRCLRPRPVPGLDLDG